MPRWGCQTSDLILSPDGISSGYSSIKQDFLNISEQDHIFAIFCLNFQLTASLVWSLMFRYVLIDHTHWFRWASHCRPSRQALRNMWPSPLHQQLDLPFRAFFHGIFRPITQQHWRSPPWHEICETRGHRVSCGRPLAMSMDADGC